MNITRVKFIKPKRIPEANVQAELYRLLRNKNIKCCLEYRLEVPKYSIYMRADIAVIKDDHIVCLVECKSRLDGKIDKRGRQYKNYLSLGIPVIYCMSFGEVISCFAHIMDLYQSCYQFKKE